MEKLHAWLQTQFDESKEEPNSGLGEAIRYLLKHWERLTLFLRQAGAPLDNNIAERGLKKAILHRKNSLFYKTQNGAQVGDLFMSLIHTCELCDANPLDYLTALQKHSAELARNQLGLDAVELRRDTGASRRYSGCRVGIPFWSMIIPLAGNYRLWPWRGVTRKWPGNGPPARRNRQGFLATPPDGPKRRFGWACTPASPPTTSRLSHCRPGRCGNTPPGVAGPSLRR